jgi:hypothetical protein
MTKRVEEFQKQQAAKRGERREIRRALREDIDHLENKLLAINLVFPSLVAAAGLFLYYSRRR